jgi:hypothetical protein
MSASVAAAVSSAWTEALGGPAAGRDFFALGGTSLGAARMAAALRRSTGLPVTVGTVLSHPTESALIAACTGLLSEVDGPAPDPAERIDGEPAPITVQQESIWFLEQIYPENPSYQSAVALWLDGELDVDRLSRAADAVCNRHELLRSSWRLVDGQLVQHVHPVVTAPFTVRPMAGASRETATAEATALARVPFDLSAAPVIRWELITLAPDRHLLVQCEHHFVHDGWSMWTILQDLAACYTGAPSAEPDPVRYADHSRRQRRWLESSQFGEQVNWWRDLLQDRSDLRPAVFDCGGATHEVTLTHEQQRRVDEISRTTGVTPFTVLMTAYVHSISAYTGQERFALGTMLRNRPPGYDDVVGMFVNTIAIPVDGSREPEVLAVELSRTMIAAQERGAVPFPLVVERLAAARDLSRNPVFQTCFSMNDRPDQRLDLGPGLRAEVVYPSNGGAKFDLDVVVIPEPDGIRMLWRYYTGLFDSTEVGHIARTFLRRLDTWTAPAGDAVAAGGERHG